jgi:hypothetical protein|tara:strand:- start:85 stop:234 length:150 start_codon:yes stop_codon:yes gene_type:complete
MPNIIYTFENNNASRQKLGSNGVQNFFGVRIGVHELSSSRYFLGKSSFN